MTLITLPKPIIYPSDFIQTISAGSANGTTLDAAGEYVAHVYQATEAMTISHVGFRPNAVTGSPTADVRIETVGTDGLPSGTLFGTDTNIVTGTLTTAWALHALTASASITKGQFFAVKFAYNSGTSFNVSQFASAVTVARSGSFYSVVNTGAATKADFLANKHAVLGSSTTTFYAMPGMLPSSGNSENVDFNSGSANTRYGLRFKIPFKARFRGARFASTLQGDFDLLLHNDAGTLLGGISVDGDHYYDDSTDGGPGPIIIDDDVTLEKDTWYRCTVAATTVTDQEVQVIVMPSADYISGTPWGANAHLTTWNGSAWSDTATEKVPHMTIVLDQIDDGTGSGSGGSFTFS